MDNTESVRILVILVYTTMYAACLFTLAPPPLMAEAQDSNSYSESSYSSAESLVIESKK